MADFPPAHPGEVLREDFLKPLHLSQYAVAKAIGVPQIRISEIVNVKRAITPHTALRLARYFGTSAEFWMGMQTTYDLETARDQVGAKIKARVHPRAACPDTPRSSIGLERSLARTGITAFGSDFAVASTLFYRASASGRSAARYRHGFVSMGAGRSSPPT